MVVPIIFDTDMSIDTDDVGALCVAHALEDLGEARLLAVTHGTGLREALPAISAINRFYGRENDVPIGISSTEIGSPAATPAGRYGDEISWTNQGRGWYASTIARSFPSIYRAEPKRAAPSALRVLRTVLAAAAEQSVTIVAVGHATNLVELLLSGPDDASPLSGYKLVELKVASMVWMGGSFLNSERVEWNFGACGASNGMCGAYDRVGALTARAVELWPPHVPITFVSFEVGEGVRAGGALYNGATNESPCRVAYNEFCGIVGYGGHLSEWCTRHGRAAWDLMAVLLAVRGAGDHYTLQPGYNAIDPAAAGRDEQRLALSSPGDSGDHGTGLARAAEGRAAAVSGDEYEVQRGRKKPPRGPARSKMPSTFRWDDL